MSNINCKKCGDNTNKSFFVKKDTVLATSAWEEHPSSFVRSIEYEIFWKHVVHKEHILKLCSNCGFKWRIDTEDNKKRDEQAKAKFTKLVKKQIDEILIGLNLNE